jgi:Rod binding domain-containing protein
VSDLSLDLRGGWLRTLAQRVGNADGELKLNVDQQRDLKKLQDSSEQFEALLVKQVLGEMRKVMGGSNASGMGGMATDMLDDSIAKNLSQSGNSWGIAQQMFLSVAQTYLRQHVAPTQLSTTETHG